jgi:hypothetical protein
MFLEQGYMLSKSNPIPITAKIATMTTKIITAITAIAKAINHPQSKKCLISAKPNYEHYNSCNQAATKGADDRTYDCTQKNYP